MNPTARPWIHADRDTPRRAGVNAFGFAGINAHAVLEEHAPSADGDRPGALRRWDTEAILFSAPDRAGLIEQIRELSELARGQSRVTRCWTWRIRSTALREHPPGRCASGPGRVVAAGAGRAPERRLAADWPTPPAGPFATAGASITGTSRS